MSAGSLMALPLSGRLVTRVGALTAIRLGMGMALVSNLVVGLGVTVFDNRWLLSLGLMGLGLGVAAWDVAMNLEGATVERHLGRTVMPHYHAAFSAGTVVAALIGSLMSYAGVSILAHLTVSAVFVTAVGWWATGRLLPEDEVAAEEAAVATEQAQRSAWREPRTLVIGLVVFAAAFTEGAANDWMAVAFVDGHDVPRWAGTLAFAVFLTFMTLGRVLGSSLIDRYGRVVMVRSTFALAIVGALMVIFGNTALAYLGAAVWGVGAALGFPVGMSASADDPRRAAARMSVVATVGYGAFIAGPPLLGFLGDHFGVLSSLLVVAALLVVALFAVPGVREPSARQPVGPAA